MIHRPHVQVVPACLALALATGAAIWCGNHVLAEEHATAQGQAAAAAGNVGGGVAGSPTGQVNVKDFSRLAADGDWSPAIQAAIDHVSARNGYENGATILFPPGTYRVHQTIRLGKDRAHSGVRLSGYGAVLLGTKTLDTQPLNYDERMKKATGEPHDAFPGELDFDGKTNVGVPILELWGPPDFEWANFVIEGLTFDREAAGQGVGIKIPAETVAKNVTFRDVKVYRQNVGVHVNYSWQIRFESCQICLNKIGIWGRNHFNSVSIVNCEIRRQHLHGVVIGPNVNQWGCTGIYIAGSIFEEIKGYGILNAGGNAVTIVGNYFEMVGNGIGVLTPYWSTTIEGNAFLAFYGHGWNINKHRGQVVADKAHVVIDAPDVQLRNNKYYGNGVLLFGLGAKTVLDTLPAVAEGVKFPPGAKVADAGGLGAYVYYADTGNFVFREFHVPSEDEALAERIRQAKRKLAIAAEEKDRVSRINAQVAAQMEIGDVLVSAGDFDRARVEYQQAFQYPAKDQLEWRSTIQTAIADSYMKQKKYREAAAAYEEAQKIGLYGWRVEHVKTNLKQAKDLAEREK